MTVLNTSYCTIEEAWGDLTGKSKKDSSKKKRYQQDPICDLYERKANAPPYTETDLVKFANEFYDKSRYQRTMKTQPTSQESVEREPSPKNLVIQQERSKYDISNDTLFEKQFELNLPPMYDGGECPNIPSSVSSNVTSEEGRIENKTLAENISSVFKTFVKPEEDVYIGKDTRMPVYNENTNYNIYNTRDVAHEEYQHYPPYTAQENYNTRGEYRDIGNEYRPSSNFKYFDDTRQFQKLKKKHSNIEILDIILYIVSGIILIFLMEQFVRIGINMQI